MNAPARRGGSSFDEISRKTTDEVLKKLKTTTKGKAALGALGFSAVFLALIWATVEYIFGGQVDFLFIAMEIVHFFGILVLVRKLLKERSCEGLSLGTQELTAMFLVSRVVSGALFEGNHHTLLDSLTLAVTGVVIYQMHTTLKATVDRKHDMSRRAMLAYIIAPCLVLAVFVNPGVKMHLGLVAWLCNILWAFSTYLEAISVIPQVNHQQQRKEGHTQCWPVPLTHSLTDSAAAHPRASGKTFHRPAPPFSPAQN